MNGAQRDEVLLAANEIQLLALAGYLVLRAVLQVHRCDAMVRQLKERNRTIAALIG